ncbi:MAG: CHAT domain-containing protein [Planctomycetota bacterium]
MPGSAGPEYGAWRVSAAAVFLLLAGAALAVVWRLRSPPRVDAEPAASVRAPNGATPDPIASLPPALRALLRPCGLTQPPEPRDLTTDEVEAAAPVLLAGGFAPEVHDQVAHMNASVAAALRAQGRPDDALRQLQDFRRSVATDWVLYEYHWLLLAEMLHHAERPDEALASIAEGLAVVEARKRAGSWRPGDPQDQECLLLSLRAMIRQAEGDVLAADEDVRRVRDMDVATPQARFHRLLVLADQLLIYDDHDWAVEVVEAAEEFVGEPLARLYLGVAQAGVPTLREQAMAHLRASREDPALTPSQRALAAAKAVQTLLLSDAPAAALRREIDAADAILVAAFDDPAQRAAAARKLNVACADAWLAHGSAMGRDGVALLEFLSADLASLVESWRGRAVDDSGHAYLWDDDRAWLLTTLLRLEWRLAPDAESRWRRVLARLLQVQSVLDLDVPPVADVDAVRAYFAGAEGGLLVYVTGRSCSLVFALDAHGAELIETLPAASRLRGRQDRLLARLQACAVSAPDAATEATTLAWDDMREVGAELVPSALAKRLTAWREMSVCSMGLLDALPFDALVVPGSDGVPIGERWPVAHAVSLAHDPQRRPAAASGAETGVLFLASLMPSSAVASRLRATPERLPEDALAACARALPAPPKLLCDEAATPAAWGEVEEAQPRLLHVIAHGHRGTWRRRPFNTVALTPEGAGADGVLSVAHLRRRPATFAVLSACDHADTVQVRGDFPLVSSLAGALLRRGVAAVLAPLGKLQLGPHLDFLASFDRHLGEGATFAEALRATRAERAGRVDFAERVRSLMLQAFGCGHAPVFERR